MTTMAGVLNSVYTVAAVAVSVLGFLFVMFATGDRETGLLIEGVIGIVLLVALGATLIV